jgi:hypothetical protein
VYYNIPPEFSLDSYNKRYGYSFAPAQYKEAYTCFRESGAPLDDAYYRIYYNIPDDFQPVLYSKRHNLGPEDTNTLYRFYQKNKTVNPLDDLYYQGYYNIPPEFSLDSYNKRYGYSFTPAQYKEAYTCFTEHDTPLDDAYLKLHFKITDNKFVWTAYLNAYVDLFPIKSPAFSSSSCEGVKEDDMRTTVYKHYGNQSYKKLSPSNEPYYRQLYNLPEDFNIEYYINSTPFIFKRDYYYVLDVYTNKILLSDIYKEIINKNEKSSHEINFLDNYEYLAQFSEITCEKDKRYYINLKDFVAAYNFKHKEIHKEIEEVKIITTIEKMTEVKRVKNKKHLHKQLDIEYSTKLNNLLTYAKTLGIANESLPILSNEIVIANTRPEVCDDVCDDVCDEDEYLETIDVEVSKEIKTMRLEKYYDSLYCTGLAYDSFESVKTNAKNLYSIYSLKKYTDNLSNFPRIQHHPSSEHHPRSEHTGELCIKNAIFFTFNRYPHIPIVFRNNIIKLGSGWMHTVICCLSNEHMLRQICAEISTDIHIIVLDYDKITYNEWNNTLLQSSFWNNILGEELILYNENILFLDNSINSLAGNVCLGYKLPHIFMYNHSGNGYSDITFRKKSVVLDFLTDLSTIDLNSCLCNDIKHHFTLDKLPEDMLYSYYVFNIRCKKQNYKNSSSLKNNEANILNLEKNILIVNYKFQEIEHCHLNPYIREFINLIQK